MALRLFFVGLVASLALDLPNGGPIQSRLQEGRSWVQARVTAPVSQETSVVVDEPMPIEANSPVEMILADAPVPAITPEPLASISSPEPTTPEILATITVEASVIDPMPMPEPAPEIAESAPASEAEIAPVVPLILTDTQPRTAAPVEVVAVTEIASPLSCSMVEEIVAEAICEAQAEAKAQTDRDTAFREVVGAMAMSFAADSSVAPESAESLSLIPEVEIVPAPAAFGEIEDEPAMCDLAGLSGLAYDLNREAEGLEPIPIPTETKVAIAPAQLEIETPAIDATNRVDRLEQAVKLTGQAAQAWASLLIQRPAIVSVQR